MLRHAFKWLVVISMVVLLVLVTASAAGAADIRQGDTVVIAAGDVINDDLYVATTLLVINGTINGDVLWAGETLNLNGKVNGSLAAIGATINIDGEVVRSVRTAGMNVNVRGKIGGDLMVAGSAVEMLNTASIGRDLVFGARKINIDSMIEKNVKGNSTEARLSNRVGNQVNIAAESLTIASTAKIQGDLVYTSSNEADIQSGATIVGATMHKFPEGRNTSTWPPLGILGSVIFFLMALVSGILVIALAPKRAKSAVAAIKSKPLATLGWGALIFFATPLAALIVCVTVIGIPVGLIGLALYGIALYLSLVVSGLFVGSWIVGRSGKFESRGIMIGAFSLGLIILTLVNLIPFIGFPLFLAIAIFGLEAMFVSEKTMRASRSANLPLAGPGQNT
jgi:cytoskeletal protein CcmA (bactofilin family)